MTNEKEIKGEIVGIKNLDPQELLVNIEKIESQELGLLLGKKVKISIGPA